MNTNFLPLVYAIHKEGVYGHGIMGISLDKNNAIEIANQCCQEDVDGYHTYAVYPVPLNTKVYAGQTPTSANLPVCYKGGDYPKIEALYSTQQLPPPRAQKVQTDANECLDSSEKPDG